MKFASRRVSIGLARIALLLFVAAPAFAQTPEDPLSATTAALVAARERLAGAADPVPRARLLLETGDPDGVMALGKQLSANGGIGEALLLEAAFRVQDFKTVLSTLEGWGDPPAMTPPQRHAFYRWLFLIDDLARVQVLLDGLASESDPVDDLAAGRLRLALHDWDGSEKLYRRALENARSAELRAEAHRGLARVAYKHRDWDGALESLVEGLSLDPLQPDAITELVDLLIRLGRTDEAIRALETAVSISPYHERAHYFLGNGYTEKNYTQLYKSYPEVFVGGPVLDLADQLYRGGTLNTARAGYETILVSHPKAAEALVRMGSLEFGEGNLAEARSYFLRALEACPEYGRAHNGLAKVLEAERMEMEIHRAAYESAFEETPAPLVPDIGMFVVNWSGLSARHKKRIALSIDPWRRYLPVLIEGKCTYYIKPLFELLSETPGVETLRDQRISYDSRLWDDVRGCGGYNTVTGIEDVERNIFGRYNTVLHELAHQVHGVLPAEDKRRIEELYRDTKKRDEQTGDAFLSRYAGSSVWEYFAEGANALFTPQRDAFDTREIVRTRLDEKDPALAELVRELMEKDPPPEAFVVARVNRGDDRLSRGKPEEALQSYRAALARMPGNEDALESLIHTLTVLDSIETAIEWMGTAALDHPTDGSLAAQRANVLWCGGYGLDLAVESLRSGLDQVREADRPQAHSALGDLMLVAGDADGARTAFEAALSFQSDDSAALWGLARAHALAGEWTQAWANYDAAVERRTGIVSLRESYAFDLLRAGEIENARAQIDAALLLDPAAPEALALRAWSALIGGDAQRANEDAARALEEGPWSDLARWVLARAQSALGHADASEETLAPLRDRIRRDLPPTYVFIEKLGTYRQVHRLPKVERELFAEDLDG